jgi:hypothetical protein
MSNSLQRYIAYITKHSISRSNRFQVIIPLPAAMQKAVTDANQSKLNRILNSDVVKIIRSFLSGNSTETTRALEMMTEQTELPGKQITTSDIKYNGDFYKLPYSIVYAAQQFTFVVSRDMYEKNIIDEWMNLIYDPVTHEVGYHDDFVTNIIINQLDVADNVVHSVLLRDAFPMISNPLVVSNAENDQAHRLMCMFAYRRWERLYENENLKTGVSRLAETPLGPFVAPILSNPAIQRALDVFKANTGIDLEGEAVAVYNQVDRIVQNTTGTSINKSASLIEQIRARTLNNDKISNQQKAELIAFIDTLLTTLRD